MKRIAKKSLSVLLAFVLASTMFVSAFAVTENPEEILIFNMNVDYKTNEVFSIYFVIQGYSVLNADAFACSIFDSEENEVFDQSMCDVEAMTPELLGSAKGAAVKKALAEDPIEESMDFMVVFLNVNEEFIVNPDETYTMEIYDNAFSTADGAQSEMFSYSFLPSDYIYIPTIWDKILWFLYSNPILKFIFAPLIRFIELFYYNPLDFWFTNPIFG